MLVQLVGVFQMVLVFVNEDIRHNRCAKVRGKGSVGCWTLGCSNACKNKEDDDGEEMHVEESFVMVT